MQIVPLQAFQMRLGRVIEAADRLVELVLGEFEGTVQRLEPADYLVHGPEFIVAGDAIDDAPHFPRIRERMIDFRPGETTKAPQFVQHFRSMTDGICCN